jgi:hypothetical protein
MVLGRTNKGQSVIMWMSQGVVGTNLEVAEPRRRKKVMKYAFVEENRGALEVELDFGLQLVSQVLTSSLSPFYFSRKTTSCASVTTDADGTTESRESIGI